MSRPDRLIRVVVGHEYDRGDYHQWVTLNVRMKVNRLCVQNNRIALTNATKWICNSGSCGGWAIVSDRYIEMALESAHTMLLLMEHAKAQPSPASPAFPANFVPTPSGLHIPDDEASVVDIATRKAR